jgi:hypothetical protein
MVLHVMEDHTAAMRIVMTGKNPTIRHMGRTHKVDIAWLHERISEGSMVVEITKSEEQAADIFTKFFPTGKAKEWNNNLRLIGTLNAPFQPLPPRPTKVAKEVTPAAPGCSSRGMNRTIIEFCCGPDSKLGQERAASKGCNVIRVTETEDATTEECCKRLIGQIRNLRLRDGDHPIFLFASIPCTDGSAWQNLNRKKPGGEARLAYHRRIFRKIWTTFEQVL